MITIPEALAMAVQHHQAGRLQVAEQIYRQVLVVAPDHADAWHLLGLLAHQGGMHEIAAEYIGRAIALKGTDAAFHNNLGTALKEQGKVDQAVACYRRALELRPAYAEAYNNLGVALKDQRRLDEAVACYRRALELRSAYAEANNNLGVALQDQGKLDEAVACYRRALELKPDYAKAHANLGNLLKEQGKSEAAIACYRRALELKPDYAEVHYSLGCAFQGQGRPDEAVVCYRRALELKPGYAEAYNNLGIVMQDQGKLDEAIACYRRALERKPEYAEAHYNLGIALKNHERLDEAAACYHRALRLKPDYVEAYNNLGNILKSQERLDEAAACYRRALELRPDFAEAHGNLGLVLADQRNMDEAVACYRRAFELKPGSAAVMVQLAHGLQHLCLWNELAELSRRAIESLEREATGSWDDALSPIALLALPVATTARQQQRCAERWVSQIVKPARWWTPNDRPPPRVGERITLGYLSSDFQSHAVAHQIAELFEKHDRSRFAVHAYSCGADDGSPMRRRLAAAFDRFVDLQHVSPFDSARQIRDDRVDILIDLMGYTRHSRPQIAALRPAPVQVSYLGYPATMGASFIDYLVADAFIVPADQQPYFTERLVHLPGCFLVSDGRRAISPRTPSRAECSLPERGLVFCSFNNNCKITQAVFDVWMRLLLAVPDSVLWLLEATRGAAGNLRREAQARGVAAERLVFGAMLPPEEHLARYRLVDLFLDTFPYNAHTTASDALRVGVPVLTLAGETFVSRVAGSLLHTLGLPELVTDSLEEYEAMALRLARNADLLDEMRARLAANRETSHLFDAEQFARNIERAYLIMWDIYISGKDARTFDVII
jgi:predicted O-linked N-acetylglucosamine transferase (SPINDLY family)